MLISTDSKSTSARQTGARENDFLKTRAGFAYIRECVKFGFDVADAVLFTRDLYEVEVTSRKIHGRMMTTDIIDFVYRLRGVGGHYRIRKYNMVTCQYDTVYVGVAEALCGWILDGEIEVPLDVYNTDTCAGDARKLVYNPFTYDLNHKSLYSVVEGVAANPYSWLIVNEYSCAFEVFRASAAFMRDVHSSTLSL